MVFIKLKSIAPISLNVVPLSVGIMIKWGLFIINKRIFNFASFYDIGFPGSKTAAIFKIILLVKTFEWHSIYDKLVFHGARHLFRFTTTLCFKIFAKYFSCISSTFL